MGQYRDRDLHRQVPVELIKVPQASIRRRSIVKGCFKSMFTLIDEMEHMMILCHSHRR